MRSAERLDARGAGRAVDEQQTAAVALHGAGYLTSASAGEGGEALASGGGEVGGQVALGQQLAVGDGGRLVLLERREALARGEQRACGPGARSGAT